MAYLAVVDIETVGGLGTPTGGGGRAAGFANCRVSAIGALIAETGSSAPCERFSVRDAGPLGGPDVAEPDLIARLDGLLGELSRRAPVQLVTYGGRNVGLPALRARAAVNGVRMVAIPKPWGEGSFQARVTHLDLHDLLSPRRRRRQPRRAEQVDDAGRCAVHRVLSTYLQYLRWRAMRGFADLAGFDGAVDDLAEFVAGRRAVEPHLQAWLDAWERSLADDEDPSAAAAA